MNILEQTLALLSDMRCKNCKWSKKEEYNNNIYWQCHRYDTVRNMGSDVRFCKQYEEI